MVLKTVAILVLAALLEVGGDALIRIGLRGPGYWIVAGALTLFAYGVLVNQSSVDFNRLLLITAVLTRRVGIRLSEEDVFVNVIGGLRIDEPAADLAIALAIASSVKDRPLPADMAMVGEIGLSGEIRAVSQLSARLNEAAKLGFRRVLIPKTARKGGEPIPPGVEATPIRSLDEALDVALRGK